MKVLALMGTYRKKGNGVRILQQLEASLARLGNDTLDYLFVEDLGLPFCRGCELCIRRSEELCPHKDVTLPLRDRLRSYDGFIFYSPVYGHAISALTKNLIDHLAYQYHRPILVDRPALVVATTDGSGIKETLASLEVTAVGFGCHHVGSLGVAVMLMDLDRRYRQRVQHQVDGLAEKLHEAIATGHRRTPRWSELMFFRAMRTKAQWIKVDQDYWQAHGWLQRSYFVERPLNPFTNALAAASELLTRWYVRRYAKKLGYADVAELMGK